MTTGRFSIVPIAQDGDLRLIDDGHAELGAELARVGDRERAAVHLFGLQLFGAGAFGYIRDRTTESEHVLLVGVLHHWNDQPAFDRHGDAQVDVLLVDDVIAVERGVDRADVGGARP